VEKKSETLDYGVGAISGKLVQVRAPGGVVLFSRPWTCPPSRYLCRICPSPLLRETTSYSPSVSSIDQLLLFCRHTKVSARRFCPWPGSATQMYFSAQNLCWASYSTGPTDRAIELSLSPYATFFGRHRMTHFGSTKAAKPPSVARMGGPRSHLHARTLALDANL
jgi:hypothetical protein